MRTAHHASLAGLEDYTAHVWLWHGYKVKILLFHISVTPTIVRDLDIFLAL